MKKYLIPLLVGLMIIGLTLSVFAVETSSPAVGSQNGPCVTSAPLVDDDSAALGFARKTVGGVCASLMAYMQLVCGFLTSSSRSNAFALCIVSCSIGMLYEQFRQFLAGITDFGERTKGGVLWLVMKQDHVWCY